MYIIFCGLLFICYSFCTPTTFVPCPSNSNTGICVSVGFSYPGTGSLAPEGTDMLNGYILWAQNVNSNGGIYQTATNTTIYVKLVGYNDNSNSQLTNTSYMSLITTDNVTFLLGPYGTSFNQVSNAISNQFNRLIIFGSASGDNLFEMGYTNIFSVSTSTSQYTVSALPILQAKGVKTIAIGLSNTEFTQEVLEGTISKLNTTTLQLVGTFYYPNTTTSGILSVLPSIQQLNPDAFLSFGLLADGFTVIYAAQQIGYQPKAFYLTSTPSDPQSVQQLGASASYLLAPSQWVNTLNYTGSIFGNAMGFTLAYQKRFNLSQPSFTVVQASASGVALQMAIQNAATIHQNDVLFALRNLNAVTFYGPIAFDSAGRNRLKPMFTTQVLNGIIDIVAPSFAATQSFVYPIPWNVQSSAINPQTSQSASSSILWSSSGGITTSAAVAVGVICSLLVLIPVSIFIWYGIKRHNQKKFLNLHHYELNEEDQFN